MKPLLLALVASYCHGQSLAVTIGAATSYNAQFGTTGRYSDHDSTQTAWCPDGNTYSTANDGLGPQAALVSGRNVFIVRFSADKTTETLINSMNSLGTITQDVYGNGRSMKSTGFECQDGAMYLSIYSQKISDFSSGPANILKSLDNGATWCNPAHTNHTTGACTISPSATGDLPLVTDAMFPLAAGIMGPLPVKYCQDGSIACPVVDGNDTYKYFLAQGPNLITVYGMRILLTDHKKLDGPLYQYFKGGDFRDSANWSSNSADKVDIGMIPGATNLPGQPVYIPQFSRYVTVATHGGTPTQANKLWSSPTPFGPWTLLATLTAVQHNAFFSFIHKSLQVLSPTTVSMDLVSTGDFSLRTGNPATNGYTPWFQTVTFTTVYAMGGNGTIGGSGTVH